MEPKRVDNIPGYEHPTTLKYSRNNVYKTFTEGKAPKKNEKFGTTESGKQYSSYKELDLEMEAESSTDSYKEKIVKNKE